MKVTCPECHNEVTFEETPAVGDVVECPFCGSELEVVDVSESGVFQVELIEDEK